MKISLSSTAIGIYAAFIPLLLAGCNGGSSGSTSLEPAPSIGVFIDSPVEGLNYKTQSTSGRTNSAGEFEFYPNETVTFSIGGIKFEPTIAQLRITPIEIAKKKDEDSDAEDSDTVASDFDNKEVLNIARLLQSLDADRDSKNGITINEHVHELAQNMALEDLDIATDDFETNPLVINLIALANANATDDQDKLLVSEEAAIEHLEDSLGRYPTGRCPDGQSTTYQYVGKVTYCNFAFDGAMDACGNLGVVLGDSLTLDFETSKVGSVDTADIFGSGSYVPDRGENSGETVTRDQEDGARFFIADGSTGAWKLPMIYNGTSNVGGNGVSDTTDLTVDGAKVTGGTLIFTSAAGTGQNATLEVDFVDVIDDPDAEPVAHWTAYNDAGTTDLGMNYVVGAGVFTHNYRECNGIVLKTGVE